MPLHRRGVRALRESRTVTRDDASAALSSARRLALSTLRPHLLAQLLPPAGSVWAVASQCCADEPPLSDTVTDSAEGSNDGDMPPLVLESAASGDATCRFCYEAESAGERLVAPCLCSGTQKWVHEGCLLSWRRASLLAGSRAKAASCAVCSSPFTVRGPRLPLRERLACLADEVVTCWVRATQFLTYVGCVCGACAGLSLCLRPVLWATSPHRLTLASPGPLALMDVLLVCPGLLVLLRGTHVEELMQLVLVSLVVPCVTAGGVGGCGASCVAPLWSERVSHAPPLPRAVLGTVGPPIVAARAAAAAWGLSKRGAAVGALLVAKGLGIAGGR